VPLVRAGLDLVGGLLCGEPGARGIAWLAVGTGDPSWDDEAPDPDPGRVGLVAEVARVPLTPGTRQLAYDPGAGRVVVRATIPAGVATGELRELGLFGGAASALAGAGTLVTHRVHDVVDKDEDDVVHHDLALELPGATDADLRDLVGGLLARRHGLCGITHVALGTGGGSPGGRDGLAAERWRAALEPGELRYDPATVSVVATVRLEPGEVVEGWPLGTPGAGGERRPLRIREVGLVGGGAGRALGAVVSRAVVDGPRPDEPRPFEHTTRLVLSARTDVTVPDLDGLRLDAARARLAPELVVGAVDEREVPSATSPVVVAQHPAPGALVNEAAAVAVTLARVPTTLVPEVVGLALARAKAALRNRNLTVADLVERVEVGPEGPARDVVVGTDPPPGTRVPGETAVRLSVAMPREVEVPRVLGSSLARAVVTLRRAGFGATVETDDKVSGATSGTVVFQTPAPLAIAPLDTPLKLLLAVPATVAVPPVVGLDVADAQRRIAAVGARATADLERFGPAGLAVGSVQPVPDTDAEPGTVLAQQPEADAPAPLYGTVALDVAVGAAVVVPPLRGLRQAGAESALGAAGLRVGRVTRRAERGAGAGRVVGQHPDPGRMLPAGLRVDLVLAAAARVAVPDLRGYGPEAAAEGLEARGLRLGRVGSTTGGANPGGVAEQRPRAGEVVDAGSAVDITLAAGVPALVGRARDDARQALAKAGLDADVEERPSDGQAGVVIEQRPRAGDPAPADRRVTLVVSVARTVVVPDVVGRAPSDAAARLVADELTSRIGGNEPGRDLAVPEGAVRRQDPAAGTPVARGSSVTLWLQSAAPVVVPDVTGLTVDAATQRLGTARLLWRVGPSLPSDSFAPGLIAAQDPAPPATVPVSTTVVIRPATAGAVTVPELRGLDPGSAQARLTSVGLAPRLDDRLRKLDPDGLVPRLVAAQTPGPDTRVTPGSEVTLILGVALPDLTGRQVDEARRAVSSMQFSVSEVDTFKGRVNGQVVRTDPTAGSPVVPGMPLTLVVVRGLIDLGPEVIPERVVPKVVEPIDPFRPIEPIDPLRPRPKPEPGPEPIDPFEPFDLNPIFLKPDG
jgi:beta-lactam-binding protein with PASTA domain